jgi:hypothetical protein
MATMAGVPLDHVHDHLAYSDLLFLVGEGHRRPEVPESFDALAQTPEDQLMISMATVVRATRCRGLGYRMAPSQEVRECHNR